LTAEVFPERPGRAAVRRNFVQGQVVGGSSSINGMMAQRGLPSDFDEWESLGAKGWGWQGVLPYFNALEKDLDFSGPMHGQDGCVPIRREKKSEWAPFARAVTEAMLEQGHPWFDDFNGEFGDGVSPVPLNNLPDRRVSAAMAYLDTATRARPNLRLMTRTKALRLMFEGRRAVGVEVRKESGTQVLRGRELVVSAGAIHSPALLLRSGVGPASELAALGIASVADRPGVGRNLLNHLMIHVATWLPPDAVQAAGSTSWAFTVLR
jgi:5-(hydroxymethyl)furfural/furfural oxidase